MRWAAAIALTLFVFIATMVTIHRYAELIREIYAEPTHIVTPIVRNP